MTCIKEIGMTNKIEARHKTTLVQHEKRPAYSGKPLI